MGRIYRKLKGLWNGLIGVLVNSWQMGQNDQRKAVSLAKMGLPLALISLLIFWNEPLSDISEHYVWGMLIVNCFTYFENGFKLNKSREWLRRQR